MYALIGSVAGILLILAWWHRVLLTLWVLIAMMWVSIKIGRIFPKSWNKWIQNKIMYHPLMWGLNYSVKEIEGGKLGGHLFEDDE